MDGLSPSARRIAPTSRARHLLERGGFGGTPADIEPLFRMTPRGRPITGRSCRAARLAGGSAVLPPLLRRGLPGGRVCDGGLEHRIPFSTSAPPKSSTPAVTSISRSSTRSRSCAPGGCGSAGSGLSRASNSSSPVIGRRPRRSLSCARACGRVILRVIRERCAQALHSSGVCVDRVCVDHRMLDKALRRTV
jgi:hypothetical protein